MLLEGVQMPEATGRGKRGRPKGSGPNAARYAPAVERVEALLRAQPELSCSEATRRVMGELSLRGHSERAVFDYLRRAVRERRRERAVELGRAKGLDARPLPTARSRPTAELAATRLRVAKEHLAQLHRSGVLKDVDRLQPTFDHLGSIDLGELVRSARQTMEALASGHLPGGLR